MVQNIEYYIPNHEAFFENLLEERRRILRKETGIVKIRTYVKEDAAIWDMNLLDYNGFETEDDLDRYVDDYLKLCHKSWDARKGIGDSFYPILNPSLGIGDFAAFVDGEITFNKDTSWTTPILEELRDYKKLPPIGTAKWYKRYMLLVEKMLMKTKDTGIPVNRGYYSPFDLAEALIGSRIYMDFYDDPEGVKELLDYCADVSIYFMKDFAALVKKYTSHMKYAGFFTDGVTNQSEDIATNISPKLYTEFCRPAAQKVIDAIGISMMHTHSRAMYLIEPICSMNNVINMWLPTDPNAPIPLQEIDELLITSCNVPCAIDTTDWNLIVSNMPKIIKGNFEIAYPASSVEEGKELTKKFNELVEVAKATNKPNQYRNIS